ncbi:beta-glucosidase [Elizabethkingia miricola]|uniref:beta-glucosidase n=1 Tax=Elizabethkingia miricola TaxID=172045 RepID=UPI003892B2AE
MKTQKIFILFLAIGLCFNTKAQGVIEAKSTKEIKRGVITPTDQSLINAPYLNTKLSVEERVKDLFSRLTLMEKAKLMHGSGGFADYGNIPRIGLAKLVMTDGPQGVRSTVPTTAMPSGIAMAATWNPGLIEKAGKAMGEDAAATGHSILLGPGINLMRTPLGGRTFEYFGEDPLLAGYVAAGYSKGVQSKNVAACLKHWLANNQETNRLMLSVEVDERPLRELYARGFQIAIREANPWSIMPAYNKVRGIYAAENTYINRTLAQRDFKYDGAFITDWGATSSAIKYINGGSTIRMPFDENEKYDQETINDLKSGKIIQEAFDDAVNRNLRLLFRVGAFDPINTKEKAASKESIEIAREVADEGIVLLKNQNSFLPINSAKAKKILVLGPNSDRRFTMPNPDELVNYGGSGATYPPYEISPLKGLRDKLGDRIITADWEKTPSQELIKLAKSADIVLFIGGLNHFIDHEGLVAPPDKLDLSLPGLQTEKINLLSKANPRTAVVLIGGSPMLVEDFEKNVPSIVLAWYPGMEGGHAIADILTGSISPSGHLPVTFGKRLEDWRVHRMGTEVFPGTGVTNPPKQHMKDGIEKYEEGMYIGYRSFAADKIAPRYAFGHGLSYTTFKFEKPAATTEGDFIKISFTVKNLGKRTGAAVPQIYANAPSATQDLSEEEKPVRGLVGFTKIKLAAGESRQVTISIPKADIARWSSSKKDWTIDPGQWSFDIADSSVSAQSSVKVNIL